MAVRNDFLPGEILASQDLNDTFGAKLDLAGGKILQIVRATDATDRSTTSATFVDANISVTITPQKNDSAILLIWSLFADTNAIDRQMNVQITDASNNPISGAQNMIVYGNASRLNVPTTVIGYATPATTSATTYKGRFQSGANVTIRNSFSTGQLYAIEVSA
jgi:hypothetical protein